MTAGRVDENAKEASTELAVGSVPKVLKKVGSGIGCEATSWSWIGRKNEFRFVSACLGAQQSPFFAVAPKINRFIKKAIQNQPHCHSSH